MKQVVASARFPLERILLTFWVGGVWTVGYVVAPVLFHILSRVQAGTVAGQLFSIMSIVGLITCALLFLSLAWDERGELLRQWRGLVLIAIWLIIAIAQFVLEPRMVALREAGLSGENYHAFMRLHGVSQLLFLLVSLGGLSLVVCGLRTKRS